MKSARSIYSRSIYSNSWTLEYFFLHILWTEKAGCRMLSNHPDMCECVYFGCVCILGVCVYIFWMCVCFGCVFLFGVCLCVLGVFGVCVYFMCVFGVYVF